MIIRNAEIEGVPGLDLRLEGDLVCAMGSDLPRQAGEPVLEADGAALLPGLHDHHIHLFALAAALDSLRCGPPQVHDAEALEDALRAECASRPADSREWIRGVGYCDSVAGSLDRLSLDRWVCDRPLRIQHRSGALWILNSEALARLRLEPGVATPPGVERDEVGRITGRLFRVDGWLRERLAEQTEQDQKFPSLRTCGRMLARFGVTGVTDASPGNGAAELAAFAAAVATGALPQRLELMGGDALPVATTAGVRRGALKIMLDESALPDFELLRQTIVDAHAAHRNVAVHCVTRAELVFTLSALKSAGARAGDRIEHAAVAPPALVDQIAELGLTVVTQPNFIHERGDVYRVEVDANDVEWLYRGAGFVARGVPLAGGTDAPFGDPDPWLAMRAAVSRRSASGAVLGIHEGLQPEAALALFTSSWDQPGGLARRIAVGEPADLCLLDRPWAAARSTLSSEHVRATLRAGQIIWQQGDPS